MVRIENYDILNHYKVIEEGREKIKRIALKQQNELHSNNNNNNTDKEEEADSSGGRGRGNIQLHEYLTGLKAHKTTLSAEQSLEDESSSLSSIVVPSLVGTILGAVCIGIFTGSMY